MRKVGPFLVEPRLAPPRTVVMAVSVGAVLLALGVGAIIFWAYGVDPVNAYVTIWERVIMAERGRMEVLRRAIPLLLVGVGLAVAFRARFWNIGAEGQLLAGAVAATGVALFLPLPDPWLIPVMFLAGFLAGAVWGVIPAILRIKLHVNDVISTLMMNYIMIYIVEWLIHGPWKGDVRGFAYTDMFPTAARLPVLAGSRVHWPTLVLGLVLALGAALILARTKLGYEIRVVGQSQEAARYSGIGFLKVMIGVMIISGGLAGLAGVGEVAGIHFRLRSPLHISMGYGYTAIIVAWLARGNPLAAIFSALLFGLIFAAGDVIRVRLGMPFQVTEVFNGLILFFLISSELIMYWRLRLAPKGERWTGNPGSSAS